MSRPRWIADGDSSLIPKSQFQWSSCTHLCPHRLSVRPIHAVSLVDHTIRYDTIREAILTCTQKLAASSTARNQQLKATNKCHMFPCGIFLITKARVFIRQVLMLMLMRVAVAARRHWHSVVSRLGLHVWMTSCLHVMARYRQVRRVNGRAPRETHHRAAPEGEV